MPKHVWNQLSAAKVRQIKMPGRYADGAGLYLNVLESGARSWVWRGTVNGKRVERGLGSAFIIPLAEARETALDWTRQAHRGVDPKIERDAAKRTALTFEDAARRFHAETIEPHVSNAKHRRDWIASLERYAFPTIGNQPIADIGEADVLKVLAPIWTERAETARRVRQRLRAVFDWARTAGFREPGSMNPADRVTAGLPKQRDKVQHHEAMPWKELPAFMRRLETVGGMGALALRFTILTATRSGESRLATWDEIDGDTWTIPAERMKAREPHRIPMSAPTLALIKPLRGLSGDLIFPGQRPGRPLSDMTLLAVLKRLSVPVTVHGFRSTFRDWTEEQTNYSHEVKEAALAHKVKNAVEAAYRRTDLFEKRRALMDEWATFCGGGDA